MTESERSEERLATAAYRASKAGHFTGEFLKAGAECILGTPDRIVSLGFTPDLELEMAVCIRADG